MTRALVLAAVFAALALVSVAQTAFTYQGRLQDGGLPAAGVYDLRFTLYDAATAGTQLGQVTREDVAVENGLFAVSLDFGALTAGPRWVEIAVRRGDETGAYTPILPRQHITPSPFAITAFGVAPGSVTSAGLATDAAGLAKVSGGAASVTDGGVNVTPTGAASSLSVGSYREEPEVATAVNAYMWAGIVPEEHTWQSFSPYHTGRVTKVLLYMGTMVGTGTWSFTVTFREGEGTSGAVLGSQQVSGTQQNTWVTIPITVPIMVTKDQTYSMVFSGISAAPQPALYYGKGDWYTRGRSSRSYNEDFMFHVYVAQRTLAPALVVARDGLGVGIGTHTPATALDVAGTVRATALQLPTNAGAGKILMSDAAGLAGWQDFPTGGGTAPVGPAGGDLTGAYPNPSIGAGKVTDAHIAAVDWSKVLNKPAIPTTLPPTGPAGGDLAGSYPNPTIADGALGSAKLTSDAASLPKVSGGLLAIDAGNLGVGTATPAQRLQVDGGDALVRGPRNYQDAVQINPTLLLPGTATVYVGDTNNFVRAIRNQGLFLGFNGTANVSVDPNSNLSVAGSASLNMGSTRRQMLNLHGTSYGIGVQNSTLYQRSAYGFAWFKGGSHVDTQNSPGTGGTALMTLSSTGRLALNTSGDQPQGALNVTTTGTGKVVSLNSAAGEVASVDVSGNAAIAGNLSVAGSVTAKNLPAVSYAQKRPGDPWFLEIGRGQSRVVDEVRFSVPGAGRVVVTGFVNVQMLGTIGSEGNTGEVYLEDISAGAPGVVLTFVALPSGRYHVPITYVIDVTGPRTMHLRTRAETDQEEGPLGVDESDEGYIMEHNLTAMYFPNDMTLR